jgi:hypothetical protein
VSAPFDLEALRVRALTAAPSTKAPPPRHGPGEMFLKGPIPWSWMTAALSLSGKALHVGLVLWFLAGMKKSAEVSLSLKSLERYGLSRWAAARGLQSLEDQGLILVDRGRGRKAKVTLVSTSTFNSEESR